MIVDWTAALGSLTGFVDHPTDLVTIVLIVLTIVVLRCR